MRRAALAVLGTIAGTTLLVSAKLGTPTPTSSDIAATAPDGTAIVGGSPGAVPAGSAAPGAPAAGAPASGAPAPAGSTAPGTKATTPAAPGATTPAAPKPPAPVPAKPAFKDGTYTASASYTADGGDSTIKVTVTISGGKITGASMVDTAGTSGNAKYVARAASKLPAEALAAQSANIATASGATITSGAYKSSLSAALNQARA